MVSGWPACSGFLPYNLRMPSPTPDQELKIIEALVGLGEVESNRALKEGGILAVQGVLNCQTREALNILDDLQARKLIVSLITQGGQWDVRKPMPAPRWLWHRPSTHC